VVGNQRARLVIPGGVNSGQRRIAGLEDLVITSTRGAKFTDDRGRVFTDYHGAFGPPLLGHNDPDVDAAVASTGSSLDNPGVGVTPLEIRLAEKLVEHVPSIEKVLLTMTGSEATFHALRVARTATGRRYVIKFQGCYHGWHDSVAMNVISAPDKVGKKDPLSAGILPEVLDATLVLPFNDAAAVERALREYEGQVAAVILECIPHNIGAVLPKPGFLERLRDLCTEDGCVLIFDEIITGFRHDLGGWQRICGVTPDLTTLGKSMANGWPISALGGRAELMDLFSTTPARSTGTPRWLRRRSRPSRNSNVSLCTSMCFGSANVYELASVSCTTRWTYLQLSPVTVRCTSPTSYKDRSSDTTTCSPTMPNFLLATAAN
jgi:glutamate-1-semialdehyde 2,1-aminomutase